MERESFTKGEQDTLNKQGTMKYNKGIVDLTIPDASFGMVTKDKDTVNEFFADTQGSKNKTTKSKSKSKRPKGFHHLYNNRKNQSKSP